MSLYEMWKNYIEENCGTPEDQNAFWEKILCGRKNIIPKDSR